MYVPYVHLATVIMSVNSELKYLAGFGNHFQSESIPEALPKCYTCISSILIIRSEQSS